MTAALALLILAADPTPPPPDPDASRQLVREALTVYGMGVLHQRQDRLVEAVRSLEEAVRLLYGELLVGCRWDQGCQYSVSFFRPLLFGDQKAGEASCSIRFYFAICQVQSLLCEYTVSNRQLAPAV